MKAVVLVGGFDSTRLRPLTKTVKKELLPHARSLGRWSPNSIPEHVGARTLWGLWWELGNPPEIGAQVAFLDVWEERLPRERLPIEDEMRAKAREVIRAADRVLEAPS